MAGFGCWFDGLTATFSATRSLTRSNFECRARKVCAMPHRVFHVVKNDEMQKRESHGEEEKKFTVALKSG